MAFGSCALFALLALSYSLECTTTTHFFKNALGVEHRLETLECAINGLTFLDFDTSHISSNGSCFADVELFLEYWFLWALRLVTGVAPAAGRRKLGGDTATVKLKEAKKYRVLAQEGMSRAVNSLLGIVF